MQIDKAQVDRFKAWFWGRPTTQFDFEEGEAFVQLPIEVKTKSDLPLEGDPERKYYVAETGDTYRFADGVYNIIDVYQYGVEEIYRDTPRTYTPKQTITDHSWSIPAIEAKEISGENAALATLYNVMALATDLEQIRRSQVYGYKTTLMEQLGKGRDPVAHRNVTQWFINEHRMLYRLLTSAYRSKENFHKPVVDALFKHDYILTWDDERNCAVFKMGDFVVYL